MCSGTEPDRAASIRRYGKRARSLSNAGRSVQCLPARGASNQTHDGTRAVERRTPMEVNISIGGAQKMTLTGAVLVYRGGSDAFAVWHPAKPGPGGGAPYLGEAESLTTEFLRTLSTGLGTYIAPEILPANVLVRTSELLVWWTPAQHRTVFFGEQSEAGKDLSGKRYPVPPLVFKVSGGCLSLRALEKNERPTAKTKLKTAPFWNGNEVGQICVGTMRIPESSEAMEGWER